ncbi:MAG: hypothetical protein ABR616_15640 [Dermatophilaceae bacterium]
MSITAYGPGDPQTWGPVTSSSDPRYEDVYGDCHFCGAETHDILNIDTDADEDGVYTTITFECEAHRNPCKVCEGEEISYEEDPKADERTRDGMCSACHPLVFLDGWDNPDSRTA